MTLITNLFYFICSLPLVLRRDRCCCFLFVRISKQQDLLPWTKRTPSIALGNHPGREFHVSSQHEFVSGFCISFRAQSTLCLMKYISCYMITRFIGRPYIHTILIKIVRVGLGSLIKIIKNKWKCSLETKVQYIKLQCIGVPKWIKICYRYIICSFARPLWPKFT